MSSTIDLHMHTIVSSDGQFTPKEIIEIAKKQGMRIIAVADHNSVKSVAETMRLGKQAGIKVIPACEFSAVMADGTELHIVGYNIDIHDKRILEREQKIHQMLLGFNEMFMDKALQYGFQFNKEEAYAKANDGVVTEEMIGETILADPRNDDMEELKPYRSGGIYSDNPGFNFFRNYYAQGKPLNCQLGDYNIPINEVEQIIHDNNGVMVIAHPNHNIGHNLDKLEEIMKYNPDGIEVFSSYHNEEDRQFYYQQAKQRGLIVTVGSDFHGKTKPAIQMGSVDCNEEEVLEGLRKFSLI